jgi:HPt (histidine-containing phosphotransfer) domain-containing protein
LNEVSNLGRAWPVIRSDAKPPDRDLIDPSGNSGAGEVSAEVIDLAHLMRMTFGEKRLECEVLEMFDRQAEVLLTRMNSASPKAAADLAHALVGSARGVGAWKVAAAAQRLELAARDSDPIHVVVSRRALASAIAEARAAIRQRLADHIQKNAIES